MAWMDHDAWHVLAHASASEVHTGKRVHALHDQWVDGGTPSPYWECVVMHDGT